MPRRPRIFLPNTPVHVIQRGNNRQVCFSSDKDRKALAHWLKEGSEKFGLSIHAWVFMTNHIHLLVTPEHPESIAKCMQHLGRYYVRYFNDRFGRTGTLFEGRYRAHLVDTGAYVLQCCRYIELNPVRAGMVADPADYPWSSYAAHAFGVRMKVFRPHAVYEQLGTTDSERQKAYRQLFVEELGTEVVESIRAAVQTGFVFGNDRFRDQVEILTGVAQSYRKRGPKSKTA